MQITDLLVDNLIACTNLDVKLVPGLGVPANRGPIASTASLGEIAENVKVANLAPVGPEDTSHARPTMLAGISSFAENVKKVWDAQTPGAASAKKAALTSAEWSDFWEWQGMIAAVALSNVYSAVGLNISVAELDIDGQTNSAMRCTVMEMEKDHYYRCAVTPNGAKLFYICQNGVPFALFHPMVGLCPMKQYDSGIFEDILPWFKQDVQDCHKGWKDIAATLSPYCLRRVIAWTMDNGMLGYANYLSNCCGIPLPDVAGLKKSESIAGASSIDGVTYWAGKGKAFGTVADPYLMATQLPALFLDKLMISSIGRKENNCMVYPVNLGGVWTNEPICFQNGVLENHVPVPPFKKEIMNVISGPDFTLQKLTFDAQKNHTGGIESVTVQVVFQTDGGDTLQLWKVYDAAHICQGSMPYLTLWPFVSMPAGYEHLWKRYYATWTPQIQGMIPVMDGDGKPVPIVSGNLSYAWGNQGRLHHVYRATAPSQDWPVCEGDAPFRYAELTQTDDKTGAVTNLGLVFIPRPVPGKMMDAVTSPVNLAVDFGTTSTVCALRHPNLNGGTSFVLPFLDYSKCVTCEDESARASVSNNSWLGNVDKNQGWSWNKKFFSIAQLFEKKEPPAIDHNAMPDAAQQEYYVDGRLFLASGNMLTNLARNCPAAADPLLAQQVMNDMKFNHTMNVMNYHAASIFLAGVYAYAVLYLLHEGVVPAFGVKLIKLLVSYPNDVTLDALNTNWGYAQTTLGKIMDPQLTVPISTKECYNEATATAAYHEQKGKLFGSNLVSLDIGGGTSDISISNQTKHPDEVRNLSIRYAGREIMVSSLVELFRKINPDGPQLVTDASFADLWNVENSQTQPLRILFDTICKSGEGLAFLRGLTKNSTLRMDVEMLLAGGIHMGTANDHNPTNLLRQMITMKFLMLLRLVAKMVRKNLDIFRDPATGKLDMVAGATGNMLEINLSISGTSAQLLQYVFDCSEKELAQLQIPSVTGRGAQCLNLMNTIFYEELKDKLGENEFTQLKIYVDENATKKQDVCFGMLNPNIVNLVPGAAPTAAMVPGVPGAAAGAAMVPGVPTAAAGAGRMTDDDRKIHTLLMQRKLNDYQLESDSASLERYLNNTVDKNGRTIYGMMTYWKWYESIFFGTPTKANRGLGLGIDAMSELLDNKAYATFFTSARSVVANERAAFMIEPEQEPYYEDLAGMYMVEELLDWMIAQNQ